MHQSKFPSASELYFDGMGEAFRERPKAKEIEEGKFCSLALNAHCLRQE